MLEASSSLAAAEEMVQTPKLGPVCHLLPKLKSKKLIILVCEDLLHAERPGQLCHLGGN